MKKHILTTITIWLFTLTVMAQGGLLVTGIVKDKETRKVLANVNISVQGTNIGTVTNADGVFSLKASLDELGKGVMVSHLGYQNALVSAEATPCLRYSGRTSMPICHMVSQSSDAPAMPISLPLS